MLKRRSLEDGRANGPAICIAQGIVDASLASFDDALGTESPSPFSPASSGGFAAGGRRGDLCATCIATQGVTIVCKTNAVVPWAMQIAGPLALFWSDQHQHACV